VWVFFIIIFYLRNSLQLSILCQPQEIVTNIKTFLCLEISSIFLALHHLLQPFKKSDSKGGVVFWLKTINQIFFISSFAYFRIYQFTFFVLFFPSLQFIFQPSLDVFFLWMGLYGLVGLNFYWMGFILKKMGKFIQKHSGFVAKTNM
jgi:hypothetical protein